MYTMSTWDPCPDCSKLTVRSRTRFCTVCFRRLLKSLDNWRDMLQVAAASVAGKLPPYNGMPIEESARSLKLAGVDDFDWAALARTTNTDYGGLNNVAIQRLLVKLNLCGFRTEDSQPGRRKDFMYEGMPAFEAERAYVMGWIPDARAGPPDYDLLTPVKTRMQSLGFWYIEGGTFSNNAEVKDGVIPVTCDNSLGSWGCATNSPARPDARIAGGNLLNTAFEQWTQANCSFVQFIDPEFMRAADAENGLFTTLLLVLRLENVRHRQPYCGYDLS